MHKKLKFKPEIIRVKLNPEQAVLACSCFDVAKLLTGSPINTHSSYVLECICRATRGYVCTTSQCIGPGYLNLKQSTTGSAAAS